MNETQKKAQLLYEEFVKTLEGIGAVSMPDFNIRMDAFFASKGFDQEEDILLYDALYDCKWNQMEADAEAAGTTTKVGYFPEGF
jgi:hypothetical protein